MLLLIQVPEINTTYGLMQKSGVRAGYECCKPLKLWSVVSSNLMLVGIQVSSSTCQTVRLSSNVLISTVVTSDLTGGDCKELDASWIFILPALFDSHKDFTTHSAEI